MLGALWAFETVHYTYRSIRDGALPSTVYFPSFHVGFSVRQFLVVSWVGTALLCGAGILLLVVRGQMVGKKDV